MTGKKPATTRPKWSLLIVGSVAEDVAQLVKECGSLLGIVVLGVVLGAPEYPDIAGGVAPEYAGGVVVAIV